MARFELVERVYKRFGLMEEKCHFYSNFYEIKLSRFKKKQYNIDSLK